MRKPPLKRAVFWLSQNRGANVEKYCSEAANKLLLPCNNWVLFVFRFSPLRLFPWEGFFLSPNVKYITVHFFNVFEITRWNRWSGSTLRKDYSSFGHVTFAKFSFRSILPVSMKEEKPRVISNAGFRTGASLRFQSFQKWPYWPPSLFYLLYVCCIVLPPLRFSFLRCLI